MDRVSRQIANSKQEKIQVVRSQPSAATLREGQEVMYLTRDNRLARYRKEQGRLWVSYMDSNLNKDVSIKGNLNLSGNLITKNYPAFRTYIDNNQSWGTGAYTSVEFESKSNAESVSQYDNGSNLNYTNDNFTAPLDGIYKFNSFIMFEDGDSTQVDSGEILSLVVFVDSDGDGDFTGDDEVVLIARSDAISDFPADIYWHMSINIDTKLNKGDIVKLAVYNNTGATIQPYTASTNDTKYNVITGHLVCAL